MLNKVFSIVAITSCLIFAQATEVENKKIVEQKMMLPSTAEIALSVRHIGIKTSHYIDTNLVGVYNSNSQYACVMGMLFTDIFFYTLDENKQEVEKSFTKLLSISKKAGIDPKVMSDMKNIKDYIQKKKWSKLLQDLEQNRQKIEKSYQDKLQNDLAIITEVSAWFKAFAIVTKALSNEYDSEKTNVLNQISIARHYKNELIKNSSILTLKENNLLQKNIDMLINLLAETKDGTYSKDTIVKMSELTTNNQKALLK